jgi:hypothetical protein
MAKPSESAGMGAVGKVQIPELGAKKKKCLGGQRNPLKRLDSDKRIQGNQSFFLGLSLARLGWALLDLAKFGVRLRGQI